MRKLVQLGPLFVIFGAFLWALDGVLRISLYALPPAVIVFYEHVFGFIVLLFLIGKWKKDLVRMSRKEWIAISLVALFSGALGTIFYTTALQQVQYIPFSVVVLLQQQLQPLWAILAAAIVLRERLTKDFMLWAGISLIAVYLVTFKDLTVNFSTGAQTMIAAGFAIGAGFVWGVSTAISKFVLKKVNFLTAAALRFGLAPVFAFLFIISQNQTSALTSLTQSQLVTLLVITFSTGMVALAIYYYGLKRTSARISAICELMFPLTAVFIDYFYYHKTLSVTQILGSLVLILAMYKVARMNK